ncbi:MAG TPA: ATP-dependent DNA helicase [Mycobacteriales bacterium]|nr:ATP-dependent DNA helicase [Mycobacteriales bacterium]
MTAPRWSPQELAAALRLPPPTDEQAAVIGAPLAPAVVVAGAGSGKTETMSGRVLWLVANEYVRPDQILGLTFTTKAAGELAGRIRVRLGQLRTFLGASGPAGDPALAGEPAVSTYHAYAGRLVSEHALRLGVEPSVRLLTEAMTWQLAQKVVRTYDLDVPELDNAESTVTNWVLDLAGELAEHLVEPDELRRWTDDLRTRVLARPRRSASGRGVAGEPYAEVRKLLDRAASRVALLPLVDRYTRAKHDARAMDFGDQMAIAARVADRFAEVGRAERARYAVVLLDEYQDTGHAQLTLLRALYGPGGHAVTAVGDPAQAIYGWRGASANNLHRFAAHFRTGGGDPAPVLPLSTSFRNDELVLDVANALSVEIRENVPSLTPGPRGEPGQVRAALLETVTGEADWVAGEIAAVWRADAADRRAGAGGAGGRSVAVLCRRRSQFDLVAGALRARGVPVELVGLGGLLATPEVRDLVSTLQVVSDPTAGAALARLLTGARWRVGGKDVAALGKRARALAARHEEAAQGTRDVVSDASLVEALDDLGPPEPYSAVGFERMARLADELAALRRRTAQPLPDLVADVERTLLLDVEVAAAPDRDRAAGRAHLDRFAEVAADFSVDAEMPTLGAFLAYLAAAEDAERGLEAGVVDVDTDRVQVLTVHAAKGLEWDVVAVPGLTHDVFPDLLSTRGSGWATSAPTLPYPLRGDGSDLPVFDVVTPRDQKGIDEARKDFVAACKERAVREERRLAYVAVTRARHLLLASGYWWDTAVRPRGPSPFLSELRLVRGVQVDQWADPPPEDAANPLPPPAPMPWPADPLGARRPLVEQGASLVRSALAGSAPVDEGTLFAEEDLLALGWQREAEILLAERARIAAGPATADVPLPGHLAVTDLVTLARDPLALARRVRRPVPTRPAPLARRGTAFHAWLEERYGGQRLLDLDELPGSADAEAAPDSELALLQERFLASAWADRVPDEVEVAFETVVGGVVVRGRIDAVFADPDGGWTVVDWKTGDPPRDPSAASVQLAAYRLAWAELSGTPVELVRAAFHHVRADRTVAPIDLLGAAGLHALVESIPTGR